MISKREVSIQEPQGELNLARCKGSGGSHKPIEGAVLCRIVAGIHDSFLFDEVCGSVSEAVVGDVEPLVVAVEQVERFRDKFEAHALTHLERSR